MFSKVPCKKSRLDARRAASLARRHLRSNSGSDAVARRPKHRAHVSTGGGEPGRLVPLVAGTAGGGGRDGSAIRDSADRAGTSAALCYRRIAAELRRRGMVVNHKRVARIMREDNWLGVQPRQFVVTTKSDHKLEVYLNLARRLKLTGIDQLWVADITCIRLKTEFVYLAVILDGFSRKVVGWSRERDLSSRLATAALEQAIATRRPGAGLVHHSDRGVQYASAEYVAVLEKHGLIPSMSRPANPYDNASCESFMNFETGGDLRQPVPGLSTFAFPHRRIYRPILQPATIALCLGLLFSRRI